MNKHGISRSLCTEADAKCFKNRALRTSTNIAEK